MVAALHAQAEQRVQMMERDAKQNAPWTDRTGLARKGLFGYTINRDANLVLRIAHTMDYGVFLELANQGRFAVLEPTAKSHADPYFQSVKRLVGR